MAAYKGLLGRQRVAVPGREAIEPS
jgi:hypothetical protein